MKGQGRKTPELLSEAIRLRGEGRSFNEIGDALSVSSDTVHCWLDEKYAHRRRSMVNANRRGEAHDINRIDRRPSHSDVAERLAEIPPDTRDLTSRLCGDPLPGRRAIDRRHV